MEFGSDEPLSAHHRQKDRYWGMPVPAHLVHGNGTRAATVYGCECVACWPTRKRKAAWGQGKSARQRQAESKARLANKPVPPTVKHGQYAYRFYRCRCDICVADIRRAMRQRRAKWKREGYGRYTEKDDVMIVHWRPRSADPARWACPDCGWRETA